MNKRVFAYNTFFATLQFFGFGTGLFLVLMLTQSYLLFILVFLLILLGQITTYRYLNKKERR